MKIFAMKGEFLTFGDARGKKTCELICSGRDERDSWDENTQVEVSCDSGYIKELFSVHLEVWIPLYKRQVKP